MGSHNSVTPSDVSLNRAVKAHCATDAEQSESQRLQTLLKQMTAAPDHDEVRNTTIDIQTLVDNVPDIVYALDGKGEIVSINRAVNAYGYTRDELIGRFFLDLLHDDDHDRIAKAYFDAWTTRLTQSQTLQFRIVTKLGDVRWLEVKCAMRFTPDGKSFIQEGVCRDITENVQNQNTLIRAREVLEAQVRARTDEIMKANVELQREIDERRTTEKVLRDREGELEMEKANLQEANTALKVLLKRRELDKRALEEQVIHNINRLVHPYLKRIKREITDNRHIDYLGIVESNLNDITCNFSRRLTLGVYGLSTSELKVANFIRQGKKTRDIAHLLGLSPRTVDSYRQNIRNKLRIRNKNINLRTFLMSIR